MAAVRRVRQAPGARADRLNSVLDWESMGRKPELFDVANMVGCAGMELPEALLGEMVRALIGGLADGCAVSSHVRARRLG